MTKAYDITPVPRPRMTQRDRWLNPPRAPVARYRSFVDQVKAARIQLGTEVRVRFNMPMPKSWSKKKRAEYVGTPHQQRPDLDNLQKALFDAVLDEDCIIYRVTAEKFWSETGSIVLLD